MVSQEPTDVFIACFTDFPLKNVYVYICAGWLFRPLFCLFAGQPAHQFVANQLLWAEIRKEDK